MSLLKGHIVWADDEIEMLEPHIIYLRNKGYMVTPLNSGEDAIEFCDNNKVDILHSGPIISQKIKKYFRTKSSNKQSIRYYVTDLPKYFKKNGNKFLNQEIKKVEKITLGQNIS